MSKIISRRKALATGAAGILMVNACSQKEQQNAAEVSQKLPTRPPFLSPWSPPPDLKRDLTPGQTQIRLASWSSPTTLRYRRDSDESITDIIKRVREYGYTSTNSSIRHSPWLDATEAEIKELKEALDKYDVTFFDMHTTGSNIHPDPKQRESVYRYTIESCEAAERLGCVPMVTTHTGNAGEGPAFYFNENNWTWETWKKSVNVMKKILKDTAGMKVELGVEATNMTAMNGPMPHLQLIEECGDPRLKVCLDPVNMINLSRYGRSTELIEECFNLLGENIIAAHAKDSYILPKMSVYITEVAPGKGIIDYETFLVRLSRLSSPRTLLIEHIPDEEYPAAKEYIEETAARVGVKIYS